MSTYYLKTLDKLISASAEGLLAECGLIEHPNLFLDFCRDVNLASFLYSLLQKGDFERSFPSADSSFFREEFQKSWATNLRFDTIRAELNRLFLESLGVECVFLDASLRTRAIYGNQFQQVDKSIHILIPKELQLKDISAVLRRSGFVRVYPEFEFLARVRRKLNCATSSAYAYFKRNEFMVRISVGHPTLFDLMPDTGIFTREKERIELSDKLFYVLSEQDYLVFSVLSFFELRLLGLDCLEDLVKVYLVVQKSATSEVVGFDHGLSRLVDTECRYIKAAFSGSGFADFGALGLLGRIGLYLKHAPRVRILDLFRIVFRVRYF